MRRRTAPIFFSDVNYMLENLTLKDQLSRTEHTENWSAFERLKKKRLLVKRFQRAVFGTEAGQQRFETDAQAWESLELKAHPCCLLPLFSHGSDDQWLWFSQEMPPENSKTLADSVQSGKLMRPFEIARKFADLCSALAELHAAGQLHRNIEPDVIRFVGADGVLLLEPDVGHFLDPETCGDAFRSEIFGPSDYLAPEQRTPHAKIDARADQWALAACFFAALTGQAPTPANLEKLKTDRFGKEIHDLLLKALAENPDDRFRSMDQFRDAIQRASKSLRGSLFTESGPSEPVFESAAPVPPAENASPAVAATQAAPPTATQPIEIRCPQCGQTIVANSRYCPHCNRAYEEPCLVCQAPNAFWAKNCRNCGTDLVATKQAMRDRLYSQQQQVMKLRESFGHDKALPLLKQMTLLTHPDFLTIRDWAKNMFPLVQKERKDIRMGLENVRMQAKATFDAQKYEKVQEILSQVPPTLVDDDMRKLYQEAGECLIEVDSLIREIRNSIATKKYNTLLSCVQRYLELKANDPEAKSLQEKIETLTTMTSKGGMKLRRIPPGRFYMGSHDSDEYIRNNERPQHRVTLTQSFFAGVYPVTQGDFQRVMEYNPSISSDDPRCPADNVTWFTAIEFCNKISDEDGLPHYYELSNIKRRSSGSIENADVSIVGGDGYRLMTEAEWEYVCRAGSITPWCSGDLVVEVTQYAWYFDNSPSGTQPVGLKKPNSWGIYDMHGNVMEWCYDWFSELYYQQCGEVENPTGPDSGAARSIRGGSWHFGPEATRSACRNSSNPEHASNMIGFRIARNASDDAMV